MKNDSFINPDHYQRSSKEVWRMMIDIWGKDKYIAFCEMNAFKYRMRAGLKPNQPMERELEKANWYETQAMKLRNESNNIPECIPERQTASHQPGDGAQADPGGDFCAND
tara:strand:+ start:2903 stop:3232 length:330 start_codon:yes stop_codon:yes gene_type:complete